jgi:uncharacterized delta-60 repeat protein
MPYVTYQNKKVQYNNHYIDFFVMPPFDASNLFNKNINSIVLDSNNKQVYAAGTFTKYKDVSQNGLIRLNLNGTKDAGFDIGTGFLSKTAILQIVLDSSGKIYAVGNFATYQGLPQKRLVRLNSDGTKDISFDISSGFDVMPRTITLGLNGRIYVGGEFIAYQGLPQNYLVGLNSDGTKDETFDIGEGTDGAIFSTALDSSGKLYAGGVFTTYQGSFQNGLVRLNSNGSKDETFDIGIGFEGVVYALAIDTNNKIYAGCTSNITPGTLVRLNPNGSIDTSFDVSTKLNYNVYSLAVDPNGKVYAGGNFTAYNDVSQNFLIRLNPDGTKDETFDIGTGFNNIVSSIVLDPNNNIYVGGSFTKYKDVSQNYIVKLDYNGNKI